MDAKTLDSDERFSLETLCAFWCEMGLFDKAWPLLLVLEKNGAPRYWCLLTRLLCLFEQGRHEECLSMTEGLLPADAMVHGSQDAEDHDEAARLLECLKMRARALYALGRHDEASELAQEIVRAGRVG